jgi:hypothetical protein
MSTSWVHWIDAVITSILSIVDCWDPTDQEILAQLQCVGCEIPKPGSVRLVLDEHRAVA